MGLYFVLYPFWIYLVLFLENPKNRNENRINSTIDVLSELHAHVLASVSSGLVRGSFLPISCIGIITLRVILCLQSVGRSLWKEIPLNFARSDYNLLT